MVNNLAAEILKKELDQVFKDLEMTRTHAENFELKAKEYRDGLVLLEGKKLSLISSLEKLQS
jgi:3-isopropylmalate dehydratase small subunit